MAPGSKKVLNHKTGKLQECNEELCPFASNGVNRAPYAAAGGYAGAVSARYIYVTSKVNSFVE
jgi:multiple sugar transport system substrate-binding protein